MEIEAGDKVKCPKGHENIDIVDIPQRGWYVYCYDCKKKYFEEDYD